MIEWAKEHWLLSIIIIWIVILVVFTYFWSKLFRK